MRSLRAATWTAVVLVAIAPWSEAVARPRKVTPVVTQPMHAGTLTPEMVVAMRGVGDVEISPDGSRVAYVVSVPRPQDDDPGGAYQEIWVVDARGGTPRRFTPSKERAWAPAFAPDAKRLAFLSNRATPGVKADDDEVTNLCVIDLDGGEARLITDGKTSVSSFRWSPGGESIAFVAKDPVTKEEKEARKKGRDWEVVDREFKPLRLWAIDVATGEKHQVTTDSTSVWSFDWAPDAKTLVVQISDTPRTDDSYMWTRLALVPVSGGAPAPLVHTQGKLSRPVFSPGGTHVAWLGANDANDPAAGSVFVVPAAGGEAQALTPGCPGTATWIDWVDEETLAVALTRGTAAELDLLSRRGGALQSVLAGGPVFGECALARQGGRLAFTGSTPAHPPEIFTAKLSGHDLQVTRLTTTNPDIEAVQLGAQEVVRWRAADGLEIEGILVRPLGCVPGRRYPLVVIVHGGPESCFRHGWTTSYGNWTQLLARDGFMVLLPNYRGSTGRGEDFERGDHGDVGGKEFEDVLSGVDALVERGLVDRERVGIGGGSYGGYFSALGATHHSERFVCAVVFAGITDWISMQGVSDIPEENALVHWARPFYDNMALYWQRSPLAEVNKCHTAVLIAHGDKDARVPPGQATELYTALRLLGREVEYVRYPREGHGLRESVHQLDYLQRSLGWFEKHLKPGAEARR